MLVVAVAEALVAPAVRLRPGRGVGRGRRYGLVLACLAAADDGMRPDVLLEQVLEVADALQQLLLDYLGRLGGAGIQLVARLAQEEAVRHPQPAADTGVARRPIARTADLTLAAGLATDWQPLARVGCCAAHRGGAGR